MFIVLLTKKFVQIMYFVIKTDNTFIIFTFLKNIDSVKMKTISKSQTRNTSCSENIVPWIPNKARGRCMHVFLIILYIRL